MRIDNRMWGNTIVVEPRGRLTVETARAFAHHFARLLDGGHTHIVLDLAGVAYIDSSGLGVWARRRAKTAERRGPEPSSLVDHRTADRARHLRARRKVWLTTFYHSVVAGKADTTRS